MKLRMSLPSGGPSLHSVRGEGPGGRNRTTRERRPEARSRVSSPLPRPSLDGSRAASRGPEGAQSASSPASQTGHVSGPALVMMEDRRRFAPHDPKKADFTPSRELRVVPAKWARQRAARRLLPDQKGLHGCMRLSLNQWAEVWQSIARGSASFRGVQPCSRVWTRPVCSARLAAGRAQE